MEKENFLKLHRKMLNWGWYGDNNTKILFLHILLNANWHPGECYGIPYKEGEFITSLEKLAKETNLTFSQVRTAIKHLEMTGEIASTSHGKCRVITVNNWNVYQSHDKEDNKEIASKSQDDSKEIATEIDIKNVRSIDSNKKSKRFTKPTVEEVRAFCNENGYTINPESFVNHYESKGWLVGKTPMKDWKAAARGWQSREQPKQTNNKMKGGFERKRTAEEIRELEMDGFENYKWGDANGLR